METARRKSAKGGNLSKARRPGRKDQSPGHVSGEEHKAREGPKIRSNRKKRAASSSDRTTIGKGAHQQRRKRHKNQISAKEEEPIQHSSNASLSTGVETCSKPVLHWHTPRKYVSQSHEEEMLTVALRWGETERGMMKNQPSFRLKQVKRKCKSTGMLLMQALSLRRHHIRLLNPCRTMQHLGLGEETEIREAAACFEDAVAQYLNRNGIPYKGEAEQKDEFHSNKGDGELMPPTPDFIFREPVDLYSNAASEETTMHTIHWLEVKMFYGASTIPHDNKSAVGRLLHTANKYVKLYGPGAMVFSFGCGDTLARELLSIGVVALDSHPVNLKRMEKQQRTWCANKAGEILP